MNPALLMMGLQMAPQAVGALGNLFSQLNAQKAMGAAVPEYEELTDEEAGELVNPFNESTGRLDFAKMLGSADGLRDEGMGPFDNAEVPENKVFSMNNDEASKYMTARLRANGTIPYDQTVTPNVYDGANDLLNRFYKQNHELSGLPY